MMDKFQFDKDGFNNITAGLHDLVVFFKAQKDTHDEAMPTDITSKCGDWDKAEEDIINNASKLDALFYEGGGKNATL